MLQSGERETEILLGNKQLLLVFFVVAILLGIAFTGGYMVGRGGAAKKPAAVAADTTAKNEPTPAGQIGETHSVPPEGEAQSNLNAGHKASEEMLGARKKKVAETTFTPEAGQEYLQVTSVQRDHALAVASVLRKKGFRAHAVAKPGGANLYRVLVGPIRDAGELASTRDQLRKTGFSQVVVQRYQ